MIGLHLPDVLGPGDLPRLRVDRLMNFAWKYLVPLSIANILIAAVWYEMRASGPRSYLAAAGHWLIGWLVTGDRCS